MCQHQPNQKHLLSAWNTLSLVSGCKQNWAKNQHLYYRLHMSIPWDQQVACVNTLRWIGEKIAALITITHPKDHHTKFGIHTKWGKISNLSQKSKWRPDSLCDDSFKWELYRKKVAQALCVMKVVNDEAQKYSVPMVPVAG